MTLRGSGDSVLVTSAYRRKVQLRRQWSTRLSKDNEVSLAWLEDALQRLGQEDQTNGRTKVVSYLEAVSEEVEFEMKAHPRS